MKKINYILTNIMVILFFLISSLFLILSPIITNFSSSDLISRHYKYNVQMFIYMEFISPILGIALLLYTIHLTTLTFFDKKIYKKITKGATLDIFPNYKNQEIKLNNNEALDKDIFNSKLLLPNIDIDNNSLHTVDCKINLEDKSILIRLNTLEDLRPNFQTLDENYNYLIPFNKITSAELNTIRITYFKYKVLTLTMTNKDKNIFLFNKNNHETADFFHNHLIRKDN